MWLRARLMVALRGPGKVLLLVSATGWIMLAWLLAGNPAAADHSAHAAAIASPMFHSASHFSAMWLTMTLAMAPPLLLHEIGRLWRYSLRRLRVVTIVWFVVGYAAVWMLAGVALLPVVQWVNVGAERIAVAIVLVAAWHCSPLRQRCLNACHRAPTLRVFGAAAQRDSLRYGLSTGFYCTATCGLLMLLIVLATDHHLGAMAAAAIMTTIERHVPARRPRWQVPVLRGRSIDWPDLSAAVQTL